MSRPDSVTPEDLQKFNKVRIRTALYNQIILYRDKYSRLKKWDIGTPNDYASIKLIIELYSWDIEDIAPAFYAANVANLPPL